MSRHVQSPPVSGWSCTEHRRGPDHFEVSAPFLHLQTVRPLLFSFRPEGAAPGSLCIPPLNEPAHKEEGSATGRGSCRGLGFDQAAGEGTAGRRFSDSDGWKCPKPWAPYRRKKYIKYIYWLETKLALPAIQKKLYNSQWEIWVYFKYLYFLNDSQHLWSSWVSAQLAGRLQHLIQWCGDPAVQLQDAWSQIESTVWLLGHSLPWPSTAEVHCSRNI